MTYQLISGKDSKPSVSSACKLTGISRGSYYHFQKTDISDENETLLRHEIEKIILKFAGYGYRRVTRELSNRGYVVNHKKVHRIMRDNSLLCQLKRSFKPTTNSNHTYPVYANLAKGLTLRGIDELWVANITYIRLPLGFCYLAVILDAYSRKVIGWNLSRHIDQELATGALRMALRVRNFKPGLIHHSDRGVQYACGAYIDLLFKNGILVSMSAKGNPYENAKAESFFKTLKYEEVYLNQYRDFFEARINIGRFLEDVYNKKRLHSSIGYRSPSDFEKQNLLVGVS